MKSYLMCLPALLCVTGVAFAAVPATTLQTNEQKLSYAMGLDLGEYFKSLDASFDLDVMQQGINDGYHGNPPLLSAAEIAELQQEFARSQQEAQIRTTLAMIEKNRQESQEFLQANKSEEGVIETASGLQYKVMDKGPGGSKPQPTDTVKVHYTGTLLDGTEFDSSYKRNEPAVFQVDQVIAGWQEALPLMEVGATHELYIPADLAYGDRGVPPVIEPGSMLIFQVELLEIQESDDSEGTAEE
jgi:FKBP-type peptidyl-prolyl cis-trans isomerase